MGYFYPNVCWRVIVHRGNSPKIEFYNVFHHGHFVEDICKALMNRIGREQISEKIRNSAQYYFWSKCEWEVVVSNWPRQDIEEKLDAFTQLEANWEQFIDYVMKNKKTLVRWYKENQEYDE